MGQVYVRKVGEIYERKNMYTIKIYNKKKENAVCRRRSNETTFAQQIFLFITQSQSRWYIQWV